MDNFFLRVQNTIEENTVNSKLKSIVSLVDDYNNNLLNFDEISNIKVFKEPSYSSFCNIVDARKIKNKKNLHEKSGIASLLHSVAHIEYSAIDLALDACYRFQNMPKKYYDDWISVANDEARHFALISDLMKEYDISYGDMDVHQGLFNACMKTLELIPRMALIPRYMEANGLDANEFILNKLRKLNNTQKVIDLFELILEEEIDHVKKGDIWYKYACSLKKDFTCNYFDIVNSIQKNSFNHMKNINIEARLKAGFSKEEIEFMIKI